MKKQTIIFLVLEFIILLCIFIPINKHYIYKYKQSEFNLEYYKDTMSTIELKNNELLYERKSLIINKNELEEALQISKNEIKQLNKNLSDKIAYISKLKSQIYIDTVHTTNDSIIYKDKYPTEVYFNYLNDPWLKFSGITNILQRHTKLCNINIPLHLTVGLTDNYTIFVKTDNPYIKIDSIEGAVIDQSSIKRKDKKWRFGVYGGMGVSYDIISNQVGVGPQVGVGILYLF